MLIFNDHLLLGFDLEDESRCQKKEEEEKMKGGKSFVHSFGLLVVETRHAQAPRTTERTNNHTIDSKEREEKDVEQDENASKAPRGGQRLV